jgi:hypothetical protein
LATTSAYAGSIEEESDFSSEWLGAEDQSVEVSVQHRDRTGNTFTLHCSPSTISNASCVVGGRDAEK